MKNQFLGYVSLFLKRVKKGDLAAVKGFIGLLHFLYVFFHMFDSAQSHRYVRMLRIEGENGLLDFKGKIFLEIKSFWREGGRA